MENKQLNSPNLLQKRQCKDNNKAKFHKHLLELPCTCTQEATALKVPKILLVSANPLDGHYLRVDKEIREIKGRLLISKNRDSFEMITTQATRTRDFMSEVLQHRPEFVHFCGHGSSEGIVLLDDNDEGRLIKSKPLAELFGLFSNIECVFLNSCNSINQGNEICKFIKNVVCMSNSVPDEVAIQFAVAFYEAIVNGYDVAFAFQFAKVSIDLNNVSGGDIPMLLSG